MGVLRPSCWTKDQSNTFYVLAFGYDHQADKASGKATELAILLKGTIPDPVNNIGKITWEIVATTPKASLSYPAVEDCAVSPTGGIFTALQRFDAESTSGDMKTMAGFQYTPAAAGTWTTVLAGTLHKNANWAMFSVPVSVDSQEHAVVYAVAELDGFAFSVLNPGQTSFTRSPYRWAWPDKQASNVYLKHGAGTFYGLMWAWKGGPNPKGENLSYSFKVPFATAVVPQFLAQPPIYNVSLSGDCHYGNNTLTVVDNYFMFTCRQAQFRQLYRFNGTGYEPTVNIDLRVAPQAFEGVLDRSSGRPTLFLATKQGDQLDRFSYDGRNEKMALPTVDQPLFYYTLDETPPSTPGNNHNGEGGVSPAGSGVSTGAIVGIVIGVLVVLAGVALLLIRRTKKKKMGKQSTKDGRQASQSPSRADDTFAYHHQQQKPWPAMAATVPYAAEGDGDGGKIPEEESWQYPVGQPSVVTKPFYPLDKDALSSSKHLELPRASGASPQLPPYMAPLEDATVKVPVIPKATRPRAPQGL